MSGAPRQSVATSGPTDGARRRGGGGGLQGVRTAGTATTSTAATGGGLAPSTALTGPTVPAHTVVM